MVKNVQKFLKENASLQTIIFVSTVLILFLIIVFQSLSIVQMRYHISELEESVFESQNENKVLVEKIEKTSTERYVEDIARNRLGMVRSDETPVQVNEVKAEQKGQTHVLNSKDKAGIYLKEWYEELGKWLDSSKKG